MKTCLLFIISISFLPSILFAQNGNSSEAERIDLVGSYISYLQDSVVVKGRILEPIYKDTDPSVTPLYNSIINVVCVNPYETYPGIDQAIDSTFLLNRSDENGTFNFKLPRGRYVLTLYSRELDTPYLLIGIDVTEKEIEEKLIDMGDIRLEPNVICVCFDDRPYHIVLREREIAAMREARREKRAKRAGKLYRKGRREQRKLIS